MRKEERCKCVKCELEHHCPDGCGSHWTEDCYCILCYVALPIEEKIKLEKKRGKV